MERGHTVIALGAGASVAEAKWHRPKWTREHPPLDGDFFQRVQRHADQEALDRIVARARALGQLNLCGTNPPVSLESHLGRLFFEVNRRNNSLAARRDYFDLVTMYSDELRKTTSWLDGRSGPMRALLERELTEAGRVSVITFNHDLLVENALSLLPGRFGHVWCLRHAYGFDQMRTCADRTPTYSYNCPGNRGAHVPVFKLHGSLNWVFRTRDAIPPATQRTRELLIWTNRVIAAGAHRITGTARNWYLWSLIIPPIYEKHGFIRDELENVWDQASQALASARKVIFWGYSFPPADRHARYFFQAAAHENEALRQPILINPSPEAHSALWDVIHPTYVRHYKDINAFIAQ